MVEECAGNSSFRLTADNRKNNVNDPVSYVRAVKLRYRGVTYEIRANGQVFVDGVLRTLPYQDANGVKIFYSHPYVVIEVEIGLRVRFDGTHDLRVDVTAELYNSTCGLCGTYNGDRSDDFTQDDGELATSATDFGNSWATGEDPNCQRDPGPIVLCEEGSETRGQAEILCRHLIDNPGPFSGCRNLLSPTPYFDTCVYDLCATLPDQSLVCANFHQYAQACQNAGGDIINWREVVTECAMDCPSGSTYTSCGTACPPTCLDQDPSGNNCQAMCVETCECNEGLILDGTRCVPPSECGCQLPDGSYISAGETLLSDDCSLIYSCVDGVLNREQFGCGENAECSVRDGVRGCYCQEGYVGDGQDCQEECRPRRCGTGKYFDEDTCRCECKTCCPKRKYPDPETCVCKCHPLECREGYRFNTRTCKCQCKKRTCPRGFVFDWRCCDCRCKKYKTCNAPEYFSKITCQCEAGDIPPPY